MKNFFEWKIAFRNLFRNKWRSFITLSAVIVGFIGIALLGGYIIRVEGYARISTIYNPTTGHVSIYKKNSIENFEVSPKKYQITDNEIVIIKKIFDEEEFKNKVEFYGENLIGMGLLSNGKTSVPIIINGITPSVSHQIFTHPEVLRWKKILTISDKGIDLLEATKDHSESVSITKDLGELIGLTPPFANLTEKNKEVIIVGRTIHGDLNAVNAQVKLQHTTGLSLAEDTSLIAPVNLLKNLYDLKGISHISVYLKEGIWTSVFVKKIQARFDELNLELEAIPYFDARIGTFYAGTVSILYIMGLFFLSLICTAVAVSILNAITIGIMERTREIGTLRSIGLSVQTISRIFTKEATLLTFAGVVISTVLAQIIAQIIYKMNIRFSPPGVAGTMQFTVNPELWMCLLLSLLFLLITAYTSFLITKRKMNKKIILLLTDSEES